MRELFMDVATWETKDDLYSTFFEVVSAPSWHGKNLDALWDSISSGEINDINVPYRIVCKNYDAILPHVKEHAERFIDTIHQLAAAGVPVEIRPEDYANNRRS